MAEKPQPPSTVNFMIYNKLMIVMSYTDVIHFVKTSLQFLQLNFYPKEFFTFYIVGVNFNQSLASGPTNG